MSKLDSAKSDALTSLGHTGRLKTQEFQYWQDIADGTVSYASVTLTGSLETDTISEKTSAAGVTIDGLLIKDGGIDEAFITGGFIDGAIIGSGSPPVTIVSSLTCVGFSGLGTAAALTIATASITLTTSFHVVDTEAAASTDTLSTLSGGSEGVEVTLLQANSNRDITIDNADNIRLAGGTFTFVTVTDTITFRKRGPNWLEISRSINT